MTDAITRAHGSQAARLLVETELHPVLKFTRTGTEVSLPQRVPSPECLAQRATCPVKRGAHHFGRFAAVRNVGSAADVIVRSDGSE